MASASAAVGAAMLARRGGAVQKVYYLTGSAGLPGYGIHGVDAGLGRGRLRNP